MAALQEEALAKRQEILGAANDQGQSLGDVPGSGEDSGGSHTAGGAPRGVGVLGDDWPDTLTTKHNLASTYRAQGRSEVGEGNCASGGARFTVRDPGDNHPDTLTTNHNLASMYRAHGRTAEATTLRGYEIQNRLASPRGNRRIL